MLLSVGEDGTVVLEQELASGVVLDSDINSRTLHGLEERIQLMLAAVGSDNLRVMLAVENEASHQRVTDVMNCLVANEVNNLTFIDKE